MEDDWDLQAVVRGCTTTTTTTTTNTTTTSSSTFTADLNPRSFYSSFGFEQDDHFLSLPDPFETRSETIEELHDLYKPFFPKPQTLSLHTNPISSLSSTLLESKVQQQPKQSLVGSRTTAPSTTTRTHSQTTPRSKRRKNQQKKVCQVPAEGLSSDMWAWRKYGQKPIKGSPYPRGYYRCSSSKGCLARKQVERNRSDPDMFIVTYTAEHNHPAPTHRNSLAGSTRQKPFTPQTAVAGDGNNKSTTKPSCSSPVSPPAALSPATSLTEEDLVQQSKKTEDEDVVEEDEDDELGFSDMVITDDFFVGLDELAVPATDGYFSDPFPASFPFSCLVNKTATAAGGG